jgi:glycosyltransferase involved in cell wall biosynthesis
MRISVVLTTYNGSRFLREQLESVVAQTRPPDELVARDDCSDDETPAILEEFAGQADFPVKLELGTSRLGSTPSFERAIGLCTGDIVALCDQDDVWRSDKLEAVHRVFSDRPDVGLVFSNAALIDEQGSPLRQAVWDIFNFDATGRWMVRRGIPAVTLTRFAAPGCTIAYRAELHRTVLPFPEALRCRQPPMHHDRWILTMVAAVAETLPLSEHLVSYRLHAGQQVGLGPFFVPGSGRSPWWSAQRTRLRWGDVVREFGHTLAAVPIVRSCLVEQRDVSSAAQAVVLLDGFVEHLEFRRRLPASRLRRVSGVLREWIRGDYHIYSNGMWSVGADLLRPRPPQPPPQADLARAARADATALT